MKKNIILVALSLTVINFISCKKKNKDGEITPTSEVKDNSFNIFSIEDDKMLGLATSQQIEADTSGFNVLEPVDFPTAYSHLQRIIDTILNTGNVRYKDEFEWRTRIIKDDSTLNAFATPGGYIYVFTGLIHYLDSEDQLAGVIGHEIAHADRRHSTDQLSKQYAITTVGSTLLGDENTLANIASSLLTLSFSRTAESEADEFSVRYLCPTAYNAAGGAGFFEKIEASGGATVPEFLSTHPDPSNRIPAFYEFQTALGCTGTATNDALYQDFKNNLP